MRMDSHQSSGDEIEKLLLRAVTYSKILGGVGDSKVAAATDQKQIAETAGTVWEILSQEGTLKLAPLMDRFTVPQNVLLMALGWLFRERKIHIELIDGDYTVRLK
jgi:Winged helix-turn-helix domain (DUF2582)